MKGKVHSSSKIAVPSSPLRSGIFTAYLDESGNSGGNYLDFQQPFYVLGGWIIDDAHANTCRDTIINWERTQLTVEAQEIKSTSVLREDGGHEKLLSLAISLLSRGAIPTCCVFEKRFGVCMNIAETFFGVHLHLAPLADVMQEAQWRREIACHLYEQLDDDILIHFAQAVRAKDQDMFTQARAVIRDTLFELNSHNLASAIESMPADVASIFPFLGTLAENSINFTVFHTQLMLLERFARVRDYASWRLHHDETSAFEKALKQVLDWVTSQPTAERPNDSDFVLYWGRLRLSEMRFLESHSEPLVRAADCYVGLLNRMFKRPALLRNIAQQNEEITRKLLNSMAMGLPPLNFYTLSSQLDCQVSQFRDRPPSERRQ